MTFDEDDVRLFQPDSPPTRLAWEDLGQVGIVTTPVGRSEPDLYWILQSLDRASSVVIPMGATGEHELLHELQARLVGFDNMAVIEAMSSTEAARFVVWQKPG